jgi:beta-lactam-binding protein with PASTA domain
VEIPNVLGESARAADINIRRRGLDVGSVAQLQLPGTPPDQVLAQAPPPNASGVSAPKISLLVAEPPLPQALIMPNFTGQPLGSVTLALQDAGLRLGVVTVAGQPGNPLSTPTIPTPQTSSASIVVSQTPAAGEKVTAGAVVNFEVR